MNSQTSTTLSMVLFIGVLVLLFGAYPLEIADTGAMVVALLCGGVAVLGLWLVRDPDERTTMLRLFCAAFALRLFFTYFAYKSGLVRYLGGGDDTGWEVGWIHSRFWAGQWVHAPTLKGVPGQSTLPENLMAVYDSSRQHNLGYNYWMAYFYYLLDVKSQLALSFLNCFWNALTVLAIYRLSREWFHRKAALFAAGAAVVLPGFLAWSALSIKETWIILLEIGLLFFTVRWYRTRHWVYPLLLALLIFITYGIRFYVAIIAVLAVPLGYACLRSTRPLRTALQGMVVATLLLAAAQVSGAVSLDIPTVVSTGMAEINQFRKGIAQGFGASGAGANTGVVLDYDLSTPQGTVMMIVVGAAYLLLSPFPWQALSGRQLLALPDVLFWWILVFGYMLPGIRYTWRKHLNVLLALAVFVVPLILLYSLTFGNVGLAYRQRGQLMPFLFILVAAGFQSRLKVSRRDEERARLVDLLRRHLLRQRTLPAPAAMAQPRAAARAAD